MGEQKKKKKKKRKKKKKKLAYCLINNTKMNKFDTIFTHKK